MLRYLRDWLEDPRGMATYYTRRVIGGAVCAVRGHDLDYIDRLLGWCPRCASDVQTAESIWRAVHERTVRDD